MSKHTQGPWKLVEVNDETVKGAVHVYGGGAAITTDVWGPTLAESDANARLIAAAPDLLAACEEALRQLSAPDCPCIPDGAMVRGGLYNAILKARGGA